MGQVEPIASSVNNVSLVVLLSEFSKINVQKIAGIVIFC